jgi:ADP-ribosylglycohydrolase
LITIGNLFETEPDNWGLRGDKFLWDDLARVFQEIPLPDSVEVLQTMLEAAFLSLTAHKIEFNDPIYIDRYAHKGASPGYILPEFWRKTALKTLTSRYLEKYETNNIRPQKYILSTVIPDNNEILHTVIAYRYVKLKNTDVIYGAYHGYAGGGVYDQGFFYIDEKNSKHTVLDFNKVDKRKDAEKFYNMLGVCADFWGDEDGSHEDESRLTKEAITLLDHFGEIQNTYLDSENMPPLKSCSRIFIDEQFDINILANVSKKWSISLSFDAAQSDTPALKPKRQQQRTLKNRFIGCLVGGAVGDALGAPVEFDSRSQILQQFGPQGIADYADAYGGIGKITDDTQMTLFTAEGLLRAWVRGRERGISSFAGVTAHAYLRWLRTQGIQSTCQVDIADDSCGWLFRHRELHSQRAPGNTCISALRDMKSFGDPATNNSKGCGGVMRVAPVGLFAWILGWRDEPQRTFKLASELAALTHGHPTGYLTAGVLAVLVQALIDGMSLADGLAAAKVILKSEPDHQETLHAIELAEELASTSTPNHEAIRRLGKGWIAEEALAISIYCSLVAKTFKQGVIMAVNHDGDSDSTGAITGNLLGAMLGVKAIPEKWLEPLELRDTIAEIAEDLFTFTGWDIGEYSENRELCQKIWKKYPGF